MAKVIYRPEWTAFLRLLHAKRLEAGLTQTECSLRLGRPQSFVSDVERGIRRLDIVQVLDMCKVLDCDFLEFMAEFEREAAASRE